MTEERPRRPAHPARGTPLAVCGHLPFGATRVRHRGEMTTPVPLWRPLTPDDVDAWAALFAAAEQHEPTGEHIGREELLDDLHDPGLPPEATTSAWLDGRMVAYALLRVQDTADTVHRARLEALVHPGQRNARMARQLLDWVEETSAQAHADTRGRVEREVQIFVHDRQRWMADVLASGGFRPVRWFVDMVMDITASEPSAAPPGGLRVVPFGEEYAEAARVAYNDAFREHWGSAEIAPDAWLHKVRATTFRPELSFLALTPENEVASFVLVSHYPAEHQTTGRKELSITNVGTRQAWRRQGMAGTLIGRALAAGHERGYQGARIGVDTSNQSGAPRLYTGIGFTVVHRWAVYSRRVRRDRAPVVAFGSESDHQGTVATRSPWEGGATRTTHPCPPGRT